jgi:hypothetical protein
VALLRRAVAVNPMYTDAYCDLGSALQVRHVQELSLGDATSSLGDAESSLGDAKSSLGDAESSLDDAES